ncbi:site-2 protease family protein [Patescibacteria group bacterium]
MVTKALRLIYLVLIISLCILTHETGHALEAQKYGVSVEKISIGFNPFNLFPTITTASRFFPGAEIELSPIALGGFAKLNQEDLANLSFSHHVTIVAAGIKFNLIGALLMSIYAILINKDLINRTGKIAMSFAALSILISFTLPAIFPLLVVIQGASLLILILIKTFKKTISEDIIGSPSELLSFVTKKNEMSDAAFTSSLMAGLALINSLIIYPLDGGVIVFKALNAANLNDNNLLLFIALTWLAALIIIIKKASLMLKRRLCID